MDLAFDHSAASYDTDFTNTPVGRAQRSQVWKYLEKSLSDKKDLSILELNCGTGEDAAFLAQLGHHVLATDVSSKMIDVCRKKFPVDKNENLNFKELDMRDLHETDGKFDIIFSNFGGLNCLNSGELQKFMVSASAKLNNEGKMIIVLISDFCLMESLYFLFTLRFSKIRRRKKEKLNAIVGPGKIPIYYYSHGKIDNMIGVKAKRRMGIGLFVPPSYLNKRFPPLMIKILNGLDKALQTFTWPSFFSDHILIEYRLHL